MYRFFSNIELCNKDEIFLKDQKEIHHIFNVLKLKKGSTVQIFNENREEVTGIIQEISRQMVVIKTNQFVKKDNSGTRIILACAIPKKSKFETIIEKATELGIDEIIPVESKRTQVIITPIKEPKKLERFRAVAINAAKQSKRITLPEILPVMKFNDAVSYLLSASVVVMPSLTMNSAPLLQTLKDLKLDNRKAVSFIIGPEGDFTQKEYEYAHKLGCLPVTLGPTVLKVETAAICVCCAANLLFR